MEAHQEQSPADKVTWIVRMFSQIVEAELLFARFGGVAMPVDVPESCPARLSLRDRRDLIMLKMTQCNTDILDK